MDFQYASQIIKESASSCLLCSGKNCSVACKKGVDAAKILYSLRFENNCGAYATAKKNTACLTCDSKECELACLKGKITRPVPVQKTISALLSLPAGVPFPVTGLLFIMHSPDAAAGRCTVPDLLRGESGPPLRVCGVRTAFPLLALLLSCVILNGRTRSGSPRSSHSCRDFPSP